MGHRNKFNKVTPSKGQKHVVKLELAIESDLQDAMKDYLLINLLVKQLASYTNSKLATRLISMHMAECYMTKQSATSDPSLVKDPRILAIIKRDTSPSDKESQVMLLQFILGIDELIVQFADESPPKGRFSKVLEDYLLAETLKGLEYSIDKLKQLNTLLKTKIHSKSLPVEEDDDLILIYDADE